MVMRAQGYAGLLPGPNNPTFKSISAKHILKLGENKRYSKEI